MADSVTLLRIVSAQLSIDGLIDFLTSSCSEHDCAHTAGKHTGESSP